ncbi:DUF2273 domain-containing protein [Acetivibrio clariflavus]|uniref:Small integral membrane protein (DUF2273) n=1 Tax=Acetivibrio clariflavus (strain DSM 19732 / NBRC 101661 / EBR45) TaxID=720554 RepID=G8LW58_ACECE|nr:DUF2273 domain-containing protein [Acetivibrio clariflavus]AEV68662.1 Small integral membrane protein (DUF2273) [Acetivibrio clariflavus DSM 19732]
MSWEMLINFYKRHYGEINGAAFGLIFALSTLFIGFFQTVFIALCVLIGYYIGKKISNDKDYLRNLLDRILPPGTYR